uniref:Uncharacterized protein n=1 Tax=Timema douglasi TaxID=61478 RepID=A0A7R8VUB6_TIMDO|nr:unnamed protein product [Timema douglasi]
MRPKGDIAFCADKVDAHTYLHDSQQSEDTLCSVGEISLLRGPGYQRAYAVKKSSAHMPALNYGIMRMLEHGLVSREKRHWFHMQVLCISSDAVGPGGGFISVLLDDIYPALYLLGLGAFCACVLLPTECAAYYRMFCNNGRIDGEIDRRVNASRRVIGCK